MKPFKPSPHHPAGRACDFSFKQQDVNKNSRLQIHFNMRDGKVTQKQIEQCAGMGWEYDSGCFYEYENEMIGYFVCGHFVEVHIDYFEGD